MCLAEMHYSLDAQEKYGCKVTCRLNASSESRCERFFQGCCPCISCCCVCGLRDQPSARDATARTPEETNKMLGILQESPGLDVLDAQMKKVQLERPL